MKQRAHPPSKYHVSHPGWWWDETEAAAMAGVVFVKSRCFWLYRAFIPFTSSDECSKNAETGWILCQQSFCLFSQLTRARAPLIKFIRIATECAQTDTQRETQAHWPHVIDDINTKSRCSEFAEAQWHWHKSASVYFYRYIQPVSQAIIQSVSQSVSHGLCVHICGNICVSPFHCLSVSIIISIQTKSKWNLTD